MEIRHGVIWFFVLGCNSVLIESFSHLQQQQQKVRKGNGSRQTWFGPLLATTADENDDENSPIETTTATLTLAGETSLSSDPLPLTSEEKLASFLDDPSNRSLLCTAGGNRPSTTILPTPKLMEVWKQRCDEVGASYPDETDAIVRVRTSGIRFPGLELESLATIGVKRTTNASTSQENTCYEFVLLFDEQKVRGLPPAVWVFKKLTGTADEDDAEANQNNQSALSVTKIGYQTVNNGSEIVFTADSLLVINVNFPAFLLKILPTNKDKAEESGSKSITRVLEKDVKASLKAFQKAYLEHVS